MSDALSLNEQAVELARSGDYASAEPLLRHAVDLWASTHGKPTAEHIAAVQNLGHVAGRLGHADRAREAYLRWAELERHRWPATDPQRADALNEIGKKLYAGGDYATAELLVLESLELRTALLGEQNPEVATSLNNLANLRENLGDADGARGLRERALEIRLATLPADHPDLADSYSSLGTNALKQNDAAQAERLFATAAKLLEVHFGALTHPSVALAYEDIASARRARNDYVGARRALRRAGEILQVAGADGEEHARALNNLADLHYSVREWATARDMYAEALEILIVARGDRHPDVGDVVNNLACQRRQVREGRRRRSPALA